MYKLSEFPKKYRYTMTEYHLFETLPKRAGQRIGSHAIAEARGEGWDVKYPLKNIVVTMNRLIDKIEANKEPFRLLKETRVPGHPHVEYWLERRPLKKANGR